MRPDGPEVRRMNSVSKRSWIMRVVFILSPTFAADDVSGMASAPHSALSLATADFARRPASEALSCAPCPGRPHSRTQKTLLRPARQALAAWLVARPFFLLRRGRG